MLSELTPFTALPTADLVRARAFYEDTLGFPPGDEEMAGGVRYSAGESGFLVYPSDFAGTNKATAMGFKVDVDTFDHEAARLRDAGVSFDTFEWEEVSWVDGVATMDGGKAVWFRDPDGNIISMFAEE